MSRMFATIFALIAMIVQIGMGFLPSGESSICIPVKVVTCDGCCDQAQKCAAPLEPSCPCDRGCERCICVPTHDENATINAHPTPKLTDVVAMAAMLLGTPLPIPATVIRACYAPPSATESPPHLGPLLTIHLVI